MPSFFEITQGGWKVWGLVASTILVLFGGGLTVYDQLSGGAMSRGTISIPLKCANPDCDYADAFSREEKREWAQKEYEQWQLDHPGEQPINPDMVIPPDMFMHGQERLSPEEVMENIILSRWGDQQLPFVCPECDQKTVYRAYQCEDCGEIFFRDHNQEYSDTCPKCNYSKRREHREKKKEAREAKREKRRR